MEDSKLSRVVLEILAHSALVTSIDEAAAGAAGAAGAEAMPTPPPMHTTTASSSSTTAETAEETATEAILALSRILTSTFADPSLHPLLYRYVTCIYAYNNRHNYTPYTHIYTHIHTYAHL
jgi:hypothetical protein